MKIATNNISPIKITFQLVLLSLAVLALSTLLRPLTRLSHLSRHLIKTAPPTQGPPSSILSHASFTRPVSALVNMSSSSPDYAHELRIASLAVSRAVLLTQSVFSSHSKGTLSKSDSSPVTIGDFGAQALIIAAIRHAFPHDAVVGEEEASSLRSNAALSAQIFALVQDAKLDDGADSELGEVRSEAEMIEAIDAGNAKGGRHGRFWALDPIDGTKGFLRGGQYAVCLGLIVDGAVRVGVLGCPNLPVSDSAPLSADIPASDRGVLFAAVSGHGATSAPLTRGALAPPTPIRMRQVRDLAAATFCESVEAGHSSHGDQAAIARRLGIRGESVRMDSQAKYGSIARGAGDIYLRLPVSATYREKIWDHAAGDLIVREAGGEVTDASGERLDFGRGRTLEGNKGVVAAPREVHAEVLKVVREVLEGK